jgi:hypothetical protein
MCILDMREKIVNPYLQRFLCEYIEKNDLTRLVWRQGGKSGDVKSRIIQSRFGKQFAVKNEQNIKFILEHSIEIPHIFNAYPKTLKNGVGTYKTEGSKLHATTCVEYVIDYPNPKILDKEAISNLSGILDTYLNITCTER